MRHLNIEFKIILSVILFTFFIISLERYQVSANMMTQFIASKKAKNRLLIETISPIISLNISLGLDEANKEYLDQIIKQNSDLNRIALIDSNKNSIYQKSKKDKIYKKGDFNFCTKEIQDTLTNEKIASISLYFADDDYQEILKQNRKTTFYIFAITLISLGILILLIKREFRDLKILSKNVLNYDPQKNNFTCKASLRKDEVGVIQNAIISMVAKIHSHAKLLDELNISLEDKVAQRTKALEDANKKLEALSTTDPLTNLSNRRHFLNHTEAIWALAKRKNIEIAVIMCDIDHFKDVNDTYGHAIGDNVLENTASIMKDSLQRSTDFIARYGGEEFVVILYDTDIKTAQNICTDIQNNLKSMQILKYDGIPIKAVTLSFGISSTIPQKNDNYETLIQHADSALYQAKDRGRDRIIIY
ncbi:MAG: GGDEF domain-containing protein [Campylobacterota bacterium]|nr:GGDEF domain-containing protein [Campylobacterota bacterium]